MPKIPLVAVVDDDEAVREALCDLLMVTGLACRTFESAPAFLGDAASRDCDCLITDVRMPGMSGIDLLEKLRSDSSDLPAIVLTSVVDEHLRARADALGALAWLPKPVTDDVLLGHLKAALEGGGLVWPEDPGP
ncbi:response regulator [Sphingopyxis sp. BSN-002]|uniref:response regulator transcription factor n=1 Tax=Sphingopyxis sp. BSN-002 TaxID=2911495 RepID=UPI001EDC46AC|nr:response regulator [Sphingopyxis sp. BSN-002]UKK85337.1 response regulator [Sphingopyxis sp. BSN-002]